MIRKIRYKSLRSRALLFDTATHMIAAQLQTLLQSSPSVTLLLSGGSTPGPVYERLSDTALPWENVTVGQVDERWVDEADAGSNAALIRWTLLHGQARTARFIPMKTEAVHAAQGQAHLDGVYAEMTSQKSVAVLGMGTDGHIAAWFSGADGTSEAQNLKNANTVQAIMARQTDVTGPYLERITLTLSALLRCTSIWLLITGDEKKAVLERAMANEANDLPVTHLLRAVAARGCQTQLMILHAD